MATLNTARQLRIAMLQTSPDEWGELLDQIGQLTPDLQQVCTQFPTEFWVPLLDHCGTPKHATQWLRRCLTREHPLCAATFLFRAFDRGLLGESNLLALTEYTRVVTPGREWVLAALYLQEPTQPDAFRRFVTTEAVAFCFRNTTHQRTRTAAYLWLSDSDPEALEWINLLPRAELSLPGGLIQTP